MDSIFFERQEGQLCAQHCLNSLLQAPIFTAVDLAGYAAELDKAERDRMAEGGFSNPEFLRFMQQPSSNMDDSGFFSVQVIAKALSMWNLEIESLASPHMKKALENPTSQKAFICNHDAHWLTVRKLGQQWFNLSSLLKRPELISDTYLSLFLHQLQMEGYSIFVVIGTLPDCEADQVLSLVRVEPPASTPHSLPSSSSSSSSRSSRPVTTELDQQSHHSATGTSSGTTDTKLFKQSFSSVVRGREKEGKREEHDLQMAMALSASFEENQEQFEIDQQLRLQGMQEGEDPVFRARDEVSGNYEDEEEQAALTAAIYASLEDDPNRSGRLPVLPTHTTDRPDHTTEEPASGRGEMSTPAEKRRRTEEEKHSEGSETAELPESQEELRRRRLKHLEQNKSHLN